jgi:hypothetical protein
MLWIILYSIFVIVFNTLFFLLGGTEHSASVWISYSFTHFAYAMLLLTPLFIVKEKSVTMLGLSIYSISTTYFLIQFITGVIFILVAPEGIKAALSVQLCYAGIFGISLVAFMIANEHTAKAEEARRVRIAYVKEAAQKMKRILDSIEDKEAYRQVEKVYDVVSSSPAKSHADLEPLENSILHTIQELDKVVSTGDEYEIISLSKKLLNKANERNAGLKRHS